MICKGAKQEAMKVAEAIFSAEILSSVLFPSDNDIVMVAVNSSSISTSNNELSSHVGSIENLR